LLCGNNPSVQARFLLGPAGSGKTFRCLAEIRAELLRSAAGPPLILLAPKQATFQIERQLLGGSDGTPGGTGGGSRGRWPHAEPLLAGYTRLHIFSFERLARFVLEELRVSSPRILSEEGRVMLLRALLLRHETELKLFARSARRPGFAQELSRLLAELEQHQFSPARLDALAAQRDLPQELRHKLQDLALLATAQRDWLTEQKLHDADSLLAVAAAALRAPAAVGRWPVAALWLDGFAEMTPAEVDLLVAVAGHCGEATLAFCLDGEPPPAASWLSLWSVIGKTVQRCRDGLAALPDCRLTVENLPRAAGAGRFAGSPALQWLEAGWMRPVSPAAEISNLHSQIQLSACANPEAESVFAAREILRFVRDGGRFREAAVLVRGLDGYHKSLERAFRRHGVPFFLDRRESVAHHPLAELTRSALRLPAYDWRQEDWFVALKAGFSPATDGMIDELENAALACGWRGKKWREPLRMADRPETAARIEGLRQQIIPPFLAFAQTLLARDRHTGGEVAAAIRNLWSDLDVEARLQRWSDEAGPGAHPALHPTVWQQMNDWLKNLELAFPREALPLRDWLPILEAGLANLTVGVIPPALDQVLIGAIDRSRNPELKLVVVLGPPRLPRPASLPTLIARCCCNTAGRWALVCGTASRGSGFTVTSPSPARAGGSSRPLPPPMPTAGRSIHRRSSRTCAASSPGCWKRNFPGGWTGAPRHTPAI
jgi:ATP-dependent helicase/nuclease subunit B